VSQIIRIWAWIVGISILSISTPTVASVAAGRHLEALEIGVAAASLAVAETDTAASANPFGGLYNPATAIGCTGIQLNSLHGHFMDNIDLFSLGMVQAILDHWVIGGTWTQYQVSDIAITAVETAGPTQDISTTRSSYSTHAFTGFLATQLSPNWDAGVSVTGILSRLDSDPDTAGFGVSLTPGIRCQLSPDTAVGAYLENAISTMEWRSGTQETFARTCHLAGQTRIASLIASVDYEFVPSQWTCGEAKIGVRYPLFSFLTISAGAYPTHVNCGFGVQLGTILVDYAYIGETKEYLFSGSKITLGVRL